MITHTLDFIPAAMPPPVSNPDRIVGGRVELSRDS
jgi:hypothetical protein